MAFTFYYINLIILVIMLIPSVIFQARIEEAADNEDEKDVRYHNRSLEKIEKFGRYGTMFFYVIRLEEAKSTSYISSIISAIILIIYIAFWIILWNKNGLKRAVILSVLPSILFLSSAIIDKNYPLLLFSLIFAPVHIAISVKSAEFESEMKSTKAS